MPQVPRDSPGSKLNLTLFSPPRSGICNRLCPSTVTRTLPVGVCVGTRWLCAVDLRASLLAMIELRSSNGVVDEANDDLFTRRGSGFSGFALSHFVLPRQSWSGCPVSAASAFARASFLRSKMSHRHDRIWSLGEHGVYGVRDIL